MVTIDFCITLLETGKIDEFDSVVSELPESSELTYLRGMRADVTHDYESAITEYSAALNQLPAEHKFAHDAANRTVFCLSQLSRVGEAISFGEEQLLRLQTFETYDATNEFALRAILANIYSDRGETLRAMSLTSEKPAPNSEPWLLVHWGWSRSVVLFDAGYINEALDCARETAELVDRTTSPVTGHFLDNNIDWIRAAQGEIFTENELAEIHGRISSLENNGAFVGAKEGRVCLAYAHAQRGESDLAKAIIDDLIPHIADRASLIIRSALVFDVIGDTDACLQTYLSVIPLLSEAEETKKLAGVWRKLAAIHESRGDLESAMECMKAATDALGIGDDNANPRCISN